MNFQSRENWDSGYRVARWDSDPPVAYITLSRACVAPPEDIPGVTIYELSLGLLKGSALRQPPVFVMYDRWLHTFVLNDLMDALDTVSHKDIKRAVILILGHIAKMYGGWIIPYKAKPGDYREESSRIVKALQQHGVLGDLWCCIIDYRSVSDRMKLKESGYGI